MLRKHGPGAASNRAGYERSYGPAKSWKTFGSSEPRCCSEPSPGTLGALKPKLMEINDGSRMRHARVLRGQGCCETSLVALIRARPQSSNLPVSGCARGVVDLQTQRREAWRPVRHRAGCLGRLGAKPSHPPLSSASGGIGLAATPTVRCEAAEPDLGPAFVLAMGYHNSTRPIAGNCELL